MRSFGITDWSSLDWSFGSRFPGFGSSEPPKLNRRFANRQRLPTSCSCHCPFICIFILILSGFPIYLCITLPIYCLQSSTGGSLTAIDYLPPAPVVFHLFVNLFLSYLVCPFIYLFIFILTCLTIFFLFSLSIARPFICLCIFICPWSPIRLFIPHLLLFDKNFNLTIIVVYCLLSLICKSLLLIIVLLTSSVHPMVKGCEFVSQSLKTI